MLAIPIFRSRVAPVFNWSTRLLILPEDATNTLLGEELDLAAIPDPFQRLRLLREKGVNILICGALSPDLLNYAGKLGVSIICGVAGEVPDVLEAYCGKSLDQPIFWLPGCRHQRRCYRGSSGKRRENPGSLAAEQENGQKLHLGSGPGGNCICPRCGATIAHQRGIPCSQVACPKCGRSMVRQ